MADNNKLDEGFEEVPLDEGFQEVPTTDNKSPLDLIGVIPGVGKALQGGAEGFIDSAPAMASGASQGATMGFSDELGATGDVGLNLAKQAASGNVPNVLDVPSKWREFQKSREAANLKDKEEHPLAYMGGEIAGGIATVPLMPELGGAKLVSAAGKVSPKVAEFLAGQSGGTGAKIAGKAATSAIEGAPVGAIYGAGSSEHDISNPSELGKDILSSVEMGSLGGLAIGSIGVEGGKALVDLGKSGLNKYDFTRKMAKQFEMGEKGLDPATSRGSRLQQTLANKHIPNKTVNEIMEADSMLGEQVGASLDPTKNPNAAKLLNIDNEVQGSVQNIAKMFMDNPSLMKDIDPKARKLFEHISTSRSLGDITPLEARALKDSLYNLGNKLQGLNSDTANLAVREGTQLAKKIDTSLKSAVPEYAKAAEEFAQFRQLIPETILQPGVPLDKRTVYLGNLKNNETKLLDKTKNLLGGATMPGASSGDNSAVGLLELQQRLRTLQRTNPKVVQKLGGNADEVFKKWQDRSDTMGSIYQGQGVEPHEGLVRTGIGTVVGSGQGLGFNLSNRAGQLKTAIKQSSPVKAVKQSSPVKLGVKLAQQTDQNLMNLAQKMKANKGLATYGEGLEKALMNKDEAAKNAVLFKLLQNPDYRNMLREEGYSDEE